jgi:hypothetical protein
MPIRGILFKLAFGFLIGYFYFEYSVSRMIEFSNG